MVAGSVERIRISDCIITLILFAAPGAGVDWVMKTFTFGALICRGIWSPLTSPPTGGDDNTSDSMPFASINTWEADWKVGGFLRVNVNEYFHPAYVPVLG